MKAKHDFKYEDNYQQYLRTYLAGLAMQGILAGNALDKEMTVIQMEYYAKNYPDKTHTQCIAISAVELANELLAQLEK